MRDTDTLGLFNVDTAGQQATSNPSTPSESGEGDEDAIGSSDPEVSQPAESVASTSHPKGATIEWSGASSPSSSSGSKHAGQPLKKNTRGARKNYKFEDDSDEDSDTTELNRKTIPSKRLREESEEPSERNQKRLLTFEWMLRGDSIENPIVLDEYEGQDYDIWMTEANDIVSGNIYIYKPTYIGCAAIGRPSGRVCTGFGHFLEL